MAALYSPLDASAFVERRSWLFEQLGSQPLPRLGNQSQANLQVVNYRDAISAQAAILLDLREFEIGAKVSQRLFGSLSDEGTNLKHALFDDRNTLSAEVARAYVAESGTFGRIGVEFFQFIPSSKRFLKLGLATGHTEAAGQPWALRFQSSFFLSLPSEQSYLSVHCESARYVARGYASSLEVGGMISWSTRIRTLSAIGIHEHMLFSFGPFFGLQGSWGKVRISIPLRLWLDQEIYAARGATLKSNPLSFTPAGELSWTMAL